MHYIIYGSGDKGTAELIDYLKTMGVSHTFKDIREDADRNRENIRFLLNRGHNHVPQCFDDNLRHIGGYEDMMRELAMYEAQMTA